NRPELTAEKFIDNPFGEGKLYRSGDLVRWLPDGNIEYLGRIDEQVKIRGFRIELGEIESVIRRVEGVTDVAVIVREDKNGEKAVRAYVTAENELSISDIKEVIRKELPEYMIPAYMMQIEKIPVTRNGKLDKRALPEIEMKSEKEYIPPRNETEEKLCEIIGESLNVKQIGIEDNIFELGANSISIINIVGRVIRAGINITIQNIYENQTVKSLYEYLNGKSEYFEKYDEMHFEKYNKLLTTNQFDNEAKIITNNLGNVLVTGATGFLGAHIVANLIDNEEGKVYCLIRCENENHGYNRLRNILNHYFGKKYDSILGERIIIVSGDVSMTNLENILPLDIKTIIHSAANTKHYGLYMDFHKINVDGTKNIVEYAKEVNATLIHISTISVCSVLPVDAENHIFTERDYFKNQIIDVPYVRSKFFAEKVVLDAIESGLDAVVIRIGNQTNRSRDLKTMIDYQQNRFNYSIKNIVKIGYIKESMLNEKLELSPINETALGVIALSKKRVKQYNMFHLSNDNLVSFNKICKAFEHIGICLNVVDDNGYANIIKNIESNKKDSINNLVALGATGRETKAVALDNSFTANFLKKIGFTWSKIDQDYLNKWAMHYAAMGYWE
ncbi:SDR family oxidoreductase, partial [Bacillus gaemokensis]